MGLLECITPKIIQCNVTLYHQYYMLCLCRFLRTYLLVFLRVPSMTMMVAQVQCNPITLVGSKHSWLCQAGEDSSMTIEARG